MVHSIHVSRHTVYWVQAQVGFGRVYFPGPNRVGARAHFMRWAQPILRLSRRACARANDVNAGQPLMKNLSHFVKSVLYVPLNYRGISLLSIFSKVYSSVLNTRLSKYWPTQIPFMLVGVFDNGMLVKALNKITFCDSLQLPTIATPITMLAQHDTGFNMLGLLGCPFQTASMKTAVIFLFFVLNLFFRN